MAQYEARCKSCFPAKIKRTDTAADYTAFLCYLRVWTRRADVQYSTLSGTAPAQSYWRRFLEMFKDIGLSKIKLESIHLMAPACTVEFFDQFYDPYLEEGKPT